MLHYFALVTQHLYYILYNDCKTWIYDTSFGINLGLLRELVMQHGTLMSYIYLSDFGYLRGNLLGCLLLAEATVQRVCGIWCLGMLSSVHNLSFLSFQVAWWINTVLKGQRVEGDPHITIFIEPFS